MSYLLIQSDSRRIPLADRSVHCIVTSPPYWGLRNYHVDGQIGLERTPEEFVATMVAVFREVRRVLRDDGTCWCNLGDTYNAYNGGAGPSSSLSQGAQTTARPKLATGHGLNCKGLKPKDLIGIPWRVALALQADGWWLRSEIIWAKRNPMPESVTDRPTKSHEQVFLLAKREQYYYDAAAVREDRSSNPASVRRRDHADNGAVGTKAIRGEWFGQSGVGSNEAIRSTSGRNLRSVWSIPTESFMGAHFATFPRKLVEPCIRAGTSERGVCPACGAPWGREVAKGRPSEPTGRTRRLAANQSIVTGGVITGGVKSTTLGLYAADVVASTLGWRPSCSCDAGDPIPATVLDPFAGSGTALVVAGALGRHGVGCDLSRDYLMMARRRIERPHGRVPRPGRDERHPLFDAAGEV